MCQQCDEQMQSNAKAFEPSRRSLIKFAGISPLLMAGIGASSMMTAALADDAHTVPKPENIMSPDTALATLMKGNARYVQGNINTNDAFKHAHIGLKDGQNPYAIILSCSDSRVVPELCFDEDPGDLFVSRIAGNYVTIDVLASIEYGAYVLKSPLVMVMGHSECGAIKAAIKAESDNTTFPGHIQAIASNLSNAVRIGKQNGGNLTEEVVKANVKLNVSYLQQSTPIMRQLVQTNKVKIVGSIYNLKTGVVSLVS